MRARLVATSLGFAIVATLAAAACRFTGGLTGEGDLDAGDGGGETGTDVGCDADLAHAIDNCGACGHACTPGPSAFAACVDGGCVEQCATGFGDCDDAGAANGCETNLQNSRTNCGRCAHDCLGGACQGGACQRVTMESDINAPVHIAVDDTSVYGINAYGTVTRVAKGGGQYAIVGKGDTTIQSPAPRIALANGTLYYTSFAAGDAGDAAAGSIASVQIDGGSPRTIAPAAAPLAIAATANFVYWSEGNPASAPYQVGIKRCKTTACSTSVEVEVPTEPGRIFSIVADGADLFWANAGTPPSVPESVVAKCTPANCAATTVPLASSPPSPNTPFGLAVDKTNVYYTTSTNSGFVAFCDRGGCSGTAGRLDAFQIAPRFLASDATTLYWTNADGAVKSLPHAGPSQSERVLFEAQGTSPWDIAVDATAVYWTDTAAALPGAPPGASALFKLAR
jgi:hypothetical protein